MKKSLLPISITLLMFVSACGLFSKSSDHSDSNPAPVATPTANRGNLDGERTPAPEVTATPVAESTEQPVAESTEQPVVEQTPVATPGETPVVVEPTPQPNLDTYVEISPLITARCTGCHNSASENPRAKKYLMSTLDEVKALREKIIAELTNCKMPPRRATTPADVPVYCTTEDGKRLLSWLKSGSDL